VAAARRHSPSGRRWRRGRRWPASGWRRAVMLIGETLKVAFRSLLDHPLRALLTMLGIIIGVGAVIAVVAIGTGAQRKIEARIQAMGANLLTVNPGQMFQMGRASDVRVGLTVKDAEALQEDVDSGKIRLSQVTPE